jgi:membrane protein
LLSAGENAKRLHYMSWRRAVIGRGKSFFQILKITAQEFDSDGVVKYCASLSFYTIFSIAPMLIVAISIGSIFFGRDAINGRLFGQINEVVGTDAAIMIQEMLSSTHLKKDNTLATIIGFVVFFIGATGVFAEIQSTINRIWGLKARPKKGLLRYLFSRIWSFAMVVTVGFLAVVSLIASAVIDAINQKLSGILDNTTVIIFLVHNFVTLAIITLLFMLVFKYLPDSIVVWKDAFVGALFTSVLFIIGKYFIGLYLGSKAFESAYGAAGSVIVVLMWIYYSSFLLYFGAEFTRIYALNHGHGIRPNAFSVRIDYKEIEISSSGDLPPMSDEGA